MAVGDHFADQLRLGAGALRASKGSIVSSEEVAAGIGGKAEEHGFVFGVAVPAEERRAIVSRDHKLKIWAVKPRSSRTAEPPLDESLPSE